MKKQKGVVSIKELDETLDGYSKELLFERISIPKSALETAVQSIYDEYAEHRSGAKEIVDIYKATGIKPKYSKKRLDKIDTEMAKATSQTAGFGLGHEDAGFYIDFKVISDSGAITIEQLPKYAKTVQQCYESSYKFEWRRDLTQLYASSRVMFDVVGFAAKKKISEQEIVDKIYALFFEEGKEDKSITLSMAKDMTGMEMSTEMKKQLGKLLTDYSISTKGR